MSESTLHSVFSRRNLLRGVGVSLALPALESLRTAKLLGVEVPPNLLAKTSSGAPLRTAFVFFPNGAIPKDWWPQSTGADYKLSRTLEPLETMRDSFQVLGGLDNVSADAGGDGGGDHARGNGTFLTGVRLRKSATDIQAGISIDQLMANQIGHLTRFPSLELTSDAKRQTSGCDSGYSCAYQYNISWRSATTPMAAESNPRLVFERLFGIGSPGERGASLRQRRAEQRSVLDFVLEDARSMQRRLPTGDKQKLEEYLSGVRAIESRIQKAEQFGDPNDPVVKTPLGIPESFQEHMSLMYDLVTLAFQTDSTRIVSLMLAHDGDNRSYNEIGIVEGHHDLTHHQNKEDRIQKVREIDRWYVQQFAGFLKKLQELKDCDGNSLLHNSMIVFGSGNADGNRHTHTDLPLILAGAGGGTLQPGRHVNHGGTPLTNLYLTLADRVGIKNVNRFGDSTGKLANV